MPRRNNTKRGRRIKKKLGKPKNKKKILKRMRPVRVRKHGYPGHKYELPWDDPLVYPSEY